MVGDKSHVGCSLKVASPLFEICNNPDHLLLSNAIIQLGRNEFPRCVCNNPIILCEDSAGSILSVSFG